MKLKKIVSLVMALAMMATMSTAALAAETEQAGTSAATATANQAWFFNGEIGQASSDVTWQVIKGTDTEFLCATVPIELPIVVDTFGSVTVPTDAKIINNSEKGIDVTDITFETAALTIQNYDNAYWKKAEKTSDGSLCWPTTGSYAKGANVCLTLRGDGPSKSLAFGSTLDIPLSEGNWSIPQNSDLTLDMQAIFGSAMIETVHDAQKLCTIHFTIALKEI